MYCYRCMNQIPDNGFCPRCGAVTQPERIAHHIVPGTVLNNKYIVGNSLGEGGFGITYIGRDLNLDVRVAIKEYYPVGFASRNNTLNNDITPSSEKQQAFFHKGKERFLQEARSLARFSNEKGVVFVRDYFEACGTAYIVMEYLDGITLQEYLRQHKTIEAEKAFRMMLPIITSLEHIHKEGIIHRDISPDNIMYMPDGSLKLMDFGSARFFTNDEKEMSVLVKQGYAPEEQYRRNGAQGPWTDVYALCATIYKCITGVAPEDSLNRMHTDTLKPPSALGVRITQQLEGVLMYGLAVYQQQRCKDMAQLRALVNDALSRQATGFATAVGVGAYAQMNAGDPYRTRSVAEENRNFAYQNDDYQKTYGDGYYDRRGAMGGYQQQQQQQILEKPKRTSTSVLLIILIVVLLACVGVLAYFLLRDPDPEPTPSDSTSATEKRQEDEQTDASSEDEVSESQEDEGNALIEVPDVVGYDADDADQTLALSGFKVKLTTKYDNEHDKGEVTGQIPSGGKKAEKGSTVELTVSDGPVPTEKPEEPDGYTSAELEQQGTSYDFSDGKTLYCHFTGDIRSISLRSRATSYSEAIDEVYQDDKVSYIKTVYDFYYVNYNGKKGYVKKKYFTTSASAEYIKWDGGFPAGMWVFSKADGTLHLRASADTDGKVLASIPKRGPMKLIKIQAGQDDGVLFDMVEYNGIEGYVPDDYISDDFAATLRSDVPGM